LILKGYSFSLKVFFAMTRNKSEEQILRISGIDVREDCLSHGRRVH